MIRLSRPLGSAPTPTSVGGDRAEPHVPRLDPWLLVGWTLNRALLHQGHLLVDARLLTAEVVAPFVALDHTPDLPCAALMGVLKAADPQAVERALAQAEADTDRYRRQARAEVRRRTRAAFWYGFTHPFGRH